MHSFGCNVGKQDLVERLYASRDDDLLESDCLGMQPLLSGESVAPLAAPFKLQQRPGLMVGGDLATPAPRSAVLDTPAVAHTGDIVTPVPRPAVAPDTKKFRSLLL
ncbi:hypothetical protein E4T56_gene8054 [Termitomyces sp. T112]|nr:hypothetical protein E4T56_gene8054 [Termitomyces sp. T112]KAH0587047.1 hypothetical protein H2248_005867 [Termitomyces sp. 'cryptogamus']